MDNASSTPRVNDEAHEVDVPSDVEQAEVKASPENADSPDPSEQRATPRHTLLIRAAKLVSHHGEFVCVLRDVSEEGVSIKLFHKLPHGDPIELHMPGGGVYELSTVWERENEAGFRFNESVDVGRLINEAGEYPKRGLRLGVFFPAKVATISGSHEAVIENLSQQGARFECEGLYAIDQTIKLSSEDEGSALKDVRAKVRWRRDNQYGVVFDNTLTLGEFARLAARLQCPVLLD